MLCVTRKGTNSPEVLRSYRTASTGQNNYDCRIWEAGSATAAAPFYFQSVKFITGENWCDGGLQRNNPVNEVLDEARRIYGRQPYGAIKMMAEAEATQRTFQASYDTLGEKENYFRFSVPHGAADYPAPAQILDHSHLATIRMAIGMFKPCEGTRVL